MVEKITEEMWNEQRARIKARNDAFDSMPQPIIEAYRTLMREILRQNGSSCINVIRDALIEEFGRPDE